MTTRTRSGALNLIPMAQAADAMLSQISPNSVQVETCTYKRITKIVRIATVAELTQTQNEVIARYQKDNLFADLKAFFPSWKLTTWSMWHNWYEKEDGQFLGIFQKRFTNSVAIVSDQDIQFSDSDQDPRNKVYDILERKGYYLMSDRGDATFSWAEPWGIYWYTDGTDVVKVEVYYAHRLEEGDENTYRIKIERIGNIADLQAVEATQLRAARVNAVTDLGQLRDAEHCMVIRSNDEPPVLTVDGQVRYLSHYSQCHGNNYFIYYTVDSSGQIQELVRGNEEGFFQLNDGSWYQEEWIDKYTCPIIVNNNNLTDQDKQYLLYEYFHCPKTGAASTP